MMFRLEYGWDNSSTVFAHKSVFKICKFVHDVE
jgi:hypothetical protein